MDEDSMDGGASVASSGEVVTPGPPGTPVVGGTVTPAATPTPSKKGRGSKTRPKAGYQIFSSQIWPGIKANMGLTANFAEISREIGNQWRQLSDTEKQVYEERAKRINEENAAKFKEKQALEDEQHPPNVTLVAAGPSTSKQQQQSMPPPAQPAPSGSKV